MELTVGPGELDRTLHDVEALLDAYRTDDGLRYLDYQAVANSDVLMPDDLAVTILINSRVTLAAFKSVQDRAHELDLAKVPFLASLAVPFEVTVVTNYATISSLGWYNTFPGPVVPFLAIGFGAFLLRGAFLQLPVDLKDAASLDGFGHWRFMTRVAVPLVRPAIAALGVFAFLSAWNQYLWPLIATGDNDSVRTVQIGLKSL